MYKSPPRIVCAANRNKISDVIICGVRHWDEIMQQQKNLYDSAIKGYGEPSKAYDWEQGFTDQHGKFYTREQAMLIVKENGQSFDIERNGGQDIKLYSEGLY